MRIPDYSLFIALRYLKSRKRHRSISFNTIISTGGVALGVMALLTVLSVMSGFHEDLQRKILGVSAHGVVLNYSGVIERYEEIRDEISNIDGVVASSPFILGQVMVSYQRSARGVAVKGVDPLLEEKVSDIRMHMKEGDFDFIGGDVPGIIIGRELARSLGIFVGDYVNLISPLGEIGPLGMVPRVRQFRVNGIFEVGMFEYDSNLVFISIKSAQEFFKMGDGVTGIEMKFDDIYRADRISEEIQKRLGYPYYSVDWMKMNRNLFSALKLEKFAMFIILILIVLVASFNIVSTLMMSVIEKEREIAILKAMGAKNSGILKIFLLQGFLIGSVGTCIGIIGALILGYIINNYEVIKLPPDVYYLSRLSVKMKVFDFVLVSISSILISLGSTIYPAYQASKLDPVEPLRYE